MTTSKSTPKPSKTNALQKWHNIPVQLTDLTIFGNAYGFMRERFAEEMQRIDQQMTKFSTDLSRFYGQTSTVQPFSTMQDEISLDWDDLYSSPLVQGEGSDKALKLQFDVSQFDPTEVNVKIQNDVLTVSAAHEQKSDGAEVYTEYHREFKLPPGTDPETVVSSLSKDGVLTVQAPLPQNWANTSCCSLKQIK